MKLKITGLLLLLSCMFGGMSYSDQTTTNYGFIIPSEASRDWIDKLSNDIVSMDNILYMLSRDSAWIDWGTYITQRTITDNIGIGSLNTPRVKLDIAGALSMTGTLSVDSNASISGDMVVNGVLSVDKTLILSAETTTTLGGIVGRISILSSDGVTNCYIPVYAGS